MISKLSTKLTEKLFHKELIASEDKELYEYAFFMIGSYVFFFVLALVMGSFVGIPLETIVFYVSFCLVRNFAGGVHADTEARCTFFTTLSIVVSIIAIRTLIYSDLFIVSICIMILSATIIVILSPVDTENKRLNKQERNLYRKKTIMLTIAIMITFICMTAFGVYNIATALSVGMTLASILVVSGKIKYYMKTAR